MDFETTSEILKAAGHPVRLAILKGLGRNADCNVNEMADKLSLPQSTLSQHLTVLRNQGLITPQKEGVRTCYRISDPRIPKLLALFE
jgi:ArsR family transcriptional regulator